MKILFKLIPISVVALTILACGASGPPSAWDDMPLVYSDKDKYMFFQIEAEDNRPFSFGDFLRMVDLGDEQKATWTKDDNDNWTLSTSKFSKKKNREEQMSTRFFQKKVGSSSMDAVVLAEFINDGTPAPAFAARLLIAQAAKKYIKINHPQN